MAIIFWFVAVVISCLSPVQVASVESDVDKKPNIVLILMDDMGFNEVPWHHHTNTQMPFLEEFVNEQALRIDTFYALPLCSMTRSALLTGRYPSRYGLQLSVIENAFPFGLSIFEDIMTTDFKEAGYSTYMIGKWHQGFHREDMTPLQRGFDHFHGSLSPMLHYFSYQYEVENSPGYNGVDLWLNEEEISSDDTDSEYLTEWEKDQFLAMMDDIITNDPNNEQPFFMYVAMHAPHDPQEATSECLALYEDVTCVDRAWEEWMGCTEHQIEQAQASCADTALQEMITYLQTAQDGQIWENTLLLWMSDNGAPVWVGDNAPLRGGKKMLFEGGVRTPMFLSGGVLNSDRYGDVFSDQVPFHVVDIYPTILSAAGITTRKSELALDGVDLWDVIQAAQDQEIESELSSEREFLYNVDENSGAYRYGPWKLVLENTMEDDTVYWYDYYSTNPRLNDDGSINEDYSDYLQCGPIPEGVQTENEYDEDGNLLTMPCNEKACLFNVQEDPCEYIDLSQDEQYENLYGYMYNMLMAYSESQQLPLSEYYEGKIDPDGDPAKHDGFWRPWIRDYNALDDYEDFEDVMSEWFTANDKSEDITLSTYYQTAMEYKVKWKSQIAGLVGNDMDEGKERKQESKLINYLTLPLLIGIGLAVWIILMSCYRKYYEVDPRMKMASTTQGAHENTPLIASKG